MLLVAAAHGWNGCATGCGKYGAVICMDETGAIILAGILVSATISSSVLIGAYIVRTALSSALREIKKRE